MPRARNGLGQFIKNDNVGGNYLALPSFGTFLLFSLVFIIIYPWFSILSWVKDKIYNLYYFLINLIPEPDKLDGSTSKKTPL